MPAYICYLGKSFLMFVFAGTQCMVNLLFLGNSLDREDPPLEASGHNAFPLKYTLSGALLTITVVLLVVARYVSKKIL